MEKNKERDRARRMIAKYIRYVAERKGMQKVKVHCTPRTASWGISALYSGDTTDRQYKEVVNEVERELDITIKFFSPNRKKK